MRILALRMAGFGPYRATQSVDFTRFEDDGIFLISGRTGSGKSSILDAVSFALYGDVPRFERRDQQVRSQHCGPGDPSEVVLDFALRDVVYRVRRTPRYERLKRSGTGTTVAEPEAELSVVEADGPRVIATRPKDVGIALAEILPISKEQFLQVILLAQNRFQEFLLAPTDKRRDLLRTLFGTERFQRLERDLLDERARLAARLTAGSAEVAARADTVGDLAGVDVPAEPDVPWFTRVAEATEAAAGTADDAADAARGALAAAEAALTEVLRVDVLQRRRDDARRRHAALTATAAEIEAVRARLAAARRAAPVAFRLTALEAAEHRLGAARLAEEQARAGLAPFGAAAGEPGRRAALLTIAGGLQHPLALEAALPARQRALEEAESAVAVAESAVREGEEQVAGLPATAARVESALAEADGAAAGADALEARAAGLTEALAAAEEAEALASLLADARQAEAAASSAATAATVRLDELLQQRIAGQAFELASALVPGEPCPVCGAAEHPAPARTDAAPVTAADVDAARAAVAAAQTRLREAGEGTVGLERRLATATGMAGGRSSAALGAARAAALAASAAAAEATERAAALRRERAVLAEQADAASASLAAARETRAVAIVRRDEARAALARDRDAVDAARTGSASVAERAAAVAAELEALGALEHAEAEATAAAAARASATADVDAALAETGFPDAAAATAAALGADEERRADEAVREHEQALASASSVLAEPELADLPEEAVDPGPAALERDAVRARFEQAVGEAGGLRDRARAVRAAAEGACALLASSAAQEARYREVRDLAATVHGDEPNTRRMRLETYVLAAQLEQILAAANLRLERMTAGRYALDLDDERQHRNVETGLGIGVRDAHTGLVRQAASLSGGEMFLASLSLALGLAEVVSAQAGGIRLDTLFVDEGFGSLDGETLDTAMAALDDLRVGGRTIGLISHVESMQERIPAKLAVEVLPSGDSRVVQQVA